MPKIKGHALIELTDVHTGKKEVFEHDNFVTDWASEQWKHYGAREGQNAYSLDNMFGGIMCFDSAINENTDQSGNHTHPLFAPTGKSMVANGCVNFTDSNTNVTELGAFNSTESVTNTGTSRRYVYDWDTQEGNGTIGAVCLCPRIGGWKGVGNKTSARQITASSSDVGYGYYDFNYRGAITNYSPTIENSYSMNKVCYVKGNKVGILYQRSDLTADSITVREYDIPSTNQNPFNASGNYYSYARYTETTYSIRSYSNNSDLIIGVGCNKDFWWIIRNYPSVDYWVIDIINNDATQESYYIQKTQSDTRQGSYVLGSGVEKLGNYLLFTACYNYSNGSNLWLMAYNIATDTLSIPYQGGSGSSYQAFKAGLVKFEDVVYNDSFVVKLENGDIKVYLRNQSVPNYDDTAYAGGNIHQDMNDGYRLWTEVANTTSFYAVGLPCVWLSTINNLSTPVVKTADKTMKITYTLTLEE